MDRQSVESEAVASVGYGGAASVLEIEYRSGRIYQFVDVRRAVFEQLLTARR